jgi:transposase-like protein
MYNSTEFENRNFYSLELKHQICKEHIDKGLSLRDCVKKYNLSSHSLVHDWLRKLGYIAGLNRRTGSVYIGIENFQPLPDKPKKNNPPLTKEQQQIKFLKKELEDSRLLAEGYRRMIEIAESELKISIRKKPNTK